MTWMIQSAAGTVLAAGYTTKREASHALMRLRQIADLPETSAEERERAYGAGVVEEPPRLC